MEDRTIVHRMLYARHLRGDAGRGKGFAIPARNSHSLWLVLWADAWIPEDVRLLRKTIIRKWKW